MNRVLLKLSGEALAGDKKTGCVAVAKQVKTIVDKGVQVAIVIGGGNFWRGRTSNKIDRTKADGIGMMATIMNCMYVSEIFRTEGMDTNVYTPFACGTWTKLFSKDEAVADLNAGKVVFFAGGTGHPYFSTDMTMVLRAIEIEADAMLKGTRVDGIYTADPEKDPTATKFDKITYDEIYNKGLKIMDLTATTMCKENHLPIVVFNMDVEGNLKKLMSGEKIGTLVYEK